MGHKHGAGLSRTEPAVPAQASGMASQHRGKMGCAYLSPRAGRVQSPTPPNAAARSSEQPRSEDPNFQLPQEWENRSEPNRDGTTELSNSVGTFLNPDQH